jgi:phosphoribosylformylglycinamidine synthase I
MPKPRVCVIRSDGTNCDRETKYAFELVGGDPHIVLLESLVTGHDPVLERKESLSDYDILAIPGGFSYGDYVASGRVFVEYMKIGLGDQLMRFIEAKKPIIGICNGFQVLVKGGFLGGVEPVINGNLVQRASLTYNESYRFRDDWVKLSRPPGSDRKKCLWTKGIGMIDLPIAHGEGNFQAPDEIIEELFRANQVVFLYSNEDGYPTMDFPNNPNGSKSSIAGICDSTGIIFGLMPHPERYHDPLNHPRVIAQRLNGTLPKRGLGLDIFRNGVEYCRG